jgi:hypothetical protein
MQKQILPHSLQAINWIDQDIIDWHSRGIRYSLTAREKKPSITYSLGFNCDSSITCPNGQYAFLYQKLGTKGLLLKDGQLIREINRPYYCADVYEYPAAFVVHKGRTFLVHCPVRYCQLDLEDVETGEIITNVPGRDPSDVFHSRLEINHAQTLLISKGWCWHPYDVVCIYNIEEALLDPFSLDKRDKDLNDLGTEICTASFINDTTLLVGSSIEEFDEEAKALLPVNSFAIWNVASSTLYNIVTPRFDFGNLFAINEYLAWDLYRFPKIIHLPTGEIIDKDETVFSGDQKSSILGYQSNQPQIAFNAGKSKLAIKNEEEVIILSQE